VAVVGARATDAYGAAVAERVAEDVVALGYAVVSGGAEGCDAAAHRGAVRAGGATVVVLGGGHGRPYPRAHAGLFDEVVERGGAVVSAHWPTIPVARHRFVARNAVIAALSEAVVVVRAQGRSGALVTARAAWKLGRKVLAVPGDVGEGLSQGPHQLLERGAVALVSGAGLARALGVGSTIRSTWPVRHAGAGAPWADARGACGDADAVEFGAVGEAVLRALSSESGLDLDAMVVRTELPVDAVASALLDLELSGLIRSLPGGRYAKGAGGVGPPDG
ncbi:MAG: DNA-processing protein DprA, partial [Deltaproteobacteria bacterium]